jgi:hypothetical protein
MRSMATVCFLVLAGCLVLACGADVGDLFGEPVGTGGKDGGGGDAGAISTGGTGGNTGGQGGSTPDGGGGTGGDAGGAGGMAGEGGAGGAGGTGGGPTCDDPSEPNAVTFKCTDACLKIAVLDGGITVPTESSDDNDDCETLPFSTHPTSGQVVGVWVSDPNPAKNDAFTADSLGSYPSTCYAKCGPAPVPGPAPDHQQMETQLLNGGFSMVACGSNPAVTLGLNCTNGMYAVLQY